MNFVYVDFRLYSVWEWFASMDKMHKNEIHSFIKADFIKDSE